MSEPDIYVWADPQPKTHAEGDAAGFFDCAEAGGWLRLLPFDEMVERGAKYLCALRDDHPEREGWESDESCTGCRHEFEEMLRAALGEG